jgi:hypothetical protein
MIIYSNDLISVQFNHKVWMIVQSKSNCPYSLEYYVMLGFNFQMWMVENHIDYGYVWSIFLDFKSYLKVKNKNKSI